jgi:tetratricopeptide (TPR) repeat protein
MRTTRSFALASVLAFALVPAPARAQVNTLKGASPEAKLANQHYRNGWEAMHAESWDEAAREFQAAIDSDDKFTLAYYSLGRAEMGRHNFQKAIAAYTACKQLYVRVGGERFTNQLDYRKRLEDRILEYQTALQQAQRTSTGRGATQSQSLYTRELQTQLMTLQQAKDRNDNVTIDASIPYFVPMALGAAYFRAGQFADAEREYGEAIKSNPASGETHSNLAVLYLMTDRVALAEQEIAKAEETGFKVNPGLKDDVRKRRSDR